MFSGKHIEEHVLSHPFVFHTEFAVRSFIPQFAVLFSHLEAKQPVDRCLIASYPPKWADYSSSRLIYSSPNEVLQTRLQEKEKFSAPYSMKSMRLFTEKEYRQTREFLSGELLHQLKCLEKESA